MISGKLKKYLMPNLPYFLFFIVGWKVHAMYKWLPYPDYLVGLVVAAALRIAVYVKGKNAKKYRKDVEYGSARWGTAKDIKPYCAVSAS